MPILLVTIVLSGMGFGLVLPGLPFVARNLGASTTIATIVMGLYAVGQFIATPILGRLSDRYGRKPILVLTNLGTAGAYLLMAFAPNVWVLAAGRALSGLMAGLAPAMAYVSDVTPPEQRAVGMGRVGAAMSMGFLAGPALGGVLLGSDPVSASLRVPGLVAFAVAALTGIAALLFLPESLPPERRAARPAPAEATTGVFAAFAVVLARPVMLRCVLLGFFVYIAMAMFETIFPFWAHDRFQWGPRAVGVSFTYLAFVVMVVQGFLVGKLVPRLGEGRLAMAGLVSYAVGLTWMTQSPSWPLMMVGITLTSGGGGLFLTTMTSLVSKEAGAGERGLVLGTYQSASWMGRSLGPVVSGLLYNGLGTNSPLMAGALLLVPCVALLAAMVRRGDAAVAPGAAG
jgi:DHA1 family tetracycline resistance protein-like MFS transporter